MKGTLAQLCRVPYTGLKSVLVWDTQNMWQLAITDHCSVNGVACECPCLFILPEWTWRVTVWKQHVLLLVWSNYLAPRLQKNSFPQWNSAQVTTTLTHLPVHLQWRRAVLECSLILEAVSLADLWHPAGSCKPSSAVRDLMQVFDNMLTW